MGQVKPFFESHTAPGGTGVSGSLFIGSLDLCFEVYAKGAVSAARRVASVSQAEPF